MFSKFFPFQRNYFFIKSYPFRYIRVKKPMCLYKRKKATEDPKIHLFVQMSKWEKLVKKKQS